MRLLLIAVLLCLAATVLAAPIGPVQAIAIKPFSPTTAVFSGGLDLHLWTVPHCVPVLRGHGLYADLALRSGPPYLFAGASIGLSTAANDSHWRFGVKIAPDIKHPWVYLGETTAFIW